MSPDDAHCPHCHRLLVLHAPYPYPPRPLRCPHCRLMVGAGRAQNADGRPRRTSAHVDELPVDAVLDVLRDVHQTTRQRHLGDLEP